MDCVAEKKESQEAWAEPDDAGRLLAALLKPGNLARPANLPQLLAAVLSGSGPWTRKALREHLEMVLARCVALLDERLNRQVNAILHHPAFQALESGWRGVSLLVDEAWRSDMEDLVRIRLLDLSWPELSRDLGRAIEFDQSRLFAKIYSAEFGSPGGEPLGLVLGAYHISHRGAGGAANFDCLQGLAQIGAAAFAPVVVNADPGFFGVDRFADLAAVPELDSHFDQPEFSQWRSLRQSEDARFLALALPKMLMRQPHRRAGWGRSGFAFREILRDGDRDFLWGPACFAVGQVAIRAFCESGWFAQIRGYRPGRSDHGVVSHLPDIQRLTATGALSPPRAPVEWQVTERMGRMLAEAGFLPLMPLAHTQKLVLHAVPSVQLPRDYDRPEAQVSARLSAMLHYTLCVSRFAHYLKVLGRDQLGGYRSAEDCQRELQQWLHGYTMASEGASDAMRARYPLREAQVEVKARAGNPGSFFSVIRLQPHFQLDQLVSSMRLITELTPIQAH